MKVVSSVKRVKFTVRNFSPFWLVVSAAALEACGSSGGGSATVVPVVDVNDAPTAVEIDTATLGDKVAGATGSFTIAEDASTVAVTLVDGSTIEQYYLIGDISVTDTDTNSNFLNNVLSLTGIDESHFYISTDNKLYLTTALDFGDPMDGTVGDRDNIYNVAVVVNGSTTVRQAVSVEVTDVDFAPELVPGQAAFDAGQLEALAGSTLTFTFADLLTAFSDRDDDITTIRFDVSTFPPGVSLSYGGNTITAANADVTDPNAVFTLTAGVGITAGANMELTYSVVDSGSRVSAGTSSVSFNVVGDIAPTFEVTEAGTAVAVAVPSNSYSFTIDEGVYTSGLTLGTIVATDPDGDDAEIALSGTGVGFYFEPSISDPSTGVLMFNVDADYGTLPNLYTIEIAATEADTTSSTLTITVNIRDLNEAPTDITIDTATLGTGVTETDGVFAVGENAPLVAASVVGGEIGTSYYLIGDISVTDLDAAGSNFPANVLSTGASDFLIFGDKLYLALQQPLSHDPSGTNSYSLTITANANTALAFASADITVNVASAPMGILDTVDVGQLKTAAGSTLTFSFEYLLTAFSDRDDDIETIRFDVSTLPPGVSLSYGGNTITADVTIPTDTSELLTLTSGAGITAGANMKLTYSVVDAGDRESAEVADALFVVISDLAPAFTVGDTAVPSGSYSVTIDEGDYSATGDSFDVGTIRATDPDFIRHDAVILSDNSASGFSFSTASAAADTAVGMLSFNANADYEALDSYTIVIRATEVDGVFGDLAITVNIRDVNEVPTDITLTAADNIGGSGNVFTIADNLAPVPVTVGDVTEQYYLIGDITVEDPDKITADNVATFANVLSAEGTDGNSFYISSSFDTTDDIYTYTYKLYLTTAPNFKTKDSYSFTITAGTGTSAVSVGITLDVTDTSGDDTYVWARGYEDNTIYEEPGEGADDKLRLASITIADVSFSRNPIVSDPVAYSDRFTTADVTLTIAASSQVATDGGNVVLSYAESPFAAGTYYQGVEKVHFDTDDNGIVDAGELELNLIYQRQFNDGDAVTDVSTVTTTGSVSDDLIIGFDIAGTKDFTDTYYVRDYILAGGGDDYIYGGAGDDAYVWARGDDDDTIYEKPDEGTDKLILSGVDIANVTFSRNPVVSDPVVDSDKFTTADVTLSIANSGSITLSYEQYDSNGDGTIGGTTIGVPDDEYYQGVEKVHFDTDGDGIVDDDELVLNLIYQRQFNNGSTVTGFDITTTTGSVSADLIIGFDIPGRLVATSDNIKAGPGDDYVYGFDGNDRLYGEAGNDVIYSGADDDQVRGGDDNDRLYGGAGVDWLYGDAGNDFLYGGAGNDRINGGDGDDTLYGGAGDDTIYGGDDDDKFFHSKGDGDDIYIETYHVGTYGGSDTLVLTGFSTTDVQSIERRDDNGVNAIGNHLKLIFKDTASVAGGSTLLQYSVYANVDNVGIDRIHFDTNKDGIENDGETIWLDEDFVDIAIQYDQDIYFWARGDDDYTIYEEPREGADDKLVLSGVDIADVAFARQYIVGHGAYFSTFVTLTIAESLQGEADGGIVTLSYEQYDSNGDGTIGSIVDGTIIDGPDDEYYQGVEKVHFDTDSDGIVDDDELELDLFYQLRLTGIVVSGTDSSELVIGFGGQGTRYKVRGVGGDDYVYGSDYNDWVDGDAGNDVLYSLAGEDWLYGGDGDDWLYGGADNDILRGDADSDTLYGGEGNDELRGGVGDDTYVWARGDDDDTIYEKPNEGTDKLKLDSVDIADVIFSRNPAVGSDQLTTADVTLTIARSSQGATDGGSVVLSYAEDFFAPAGTYYQGVEKVHFDTDADGIVDADELELNLIYQRQFNGAAVAVQTTVTTSGTDSADLIIGFDIADTQDSSNNYVRDYILAGAGDDYVYGFDGNDRLYGEADDDTLYGGEGNDELRGGFVDDGSVDSLLNTGNDVLYGGAGDDSLYGGDGDDTLYGGAGDDTLYGGADIDNLYGGAGADELYGGAGDDELYGNENNDILRGNENNDILRGGAGDDILYGDDGDDELYGEIGVDELYGGAGDDELYGGAGDDELRGGADDDILRGGAGDDMLYGDDGADELYGEIGVDELYGGAGDDMLYGNENNDTLRGGDGDDMLYGNENNDTLYGGDGTDELYGGAGDDMLYGGVGADILYGEVGVDELYGGIGDDTLYGEVGNDSLYGNENNDTLRGGDGDDMLDGGAGVDTLYGEAGNDSLDGGAGNDILEGNAGNDTLYGGAGDDILYGNAGDDRLYGGADDDTYVWARDDEDDTIYEKPSEGTDKLILSRIDLADVSFSRNPVSGDQFASTDVTLTIAESLQGEADGGIITLSYEQYDSNGDATIGGADEYYQGVEKLHFDTDGDGIVDDDELVLNLVYQRQFNEFNGGVAVTDPTTVTTTGSADADLIIGFDIAGTKDFTDTYYVRDYILAGGGDDYIYGGAGNDDLYGSAGDDNYIWARGDGGDTIYEEPDEGTDKLILSRINLADVSFSRQHTGDNGVYTSVSATLMIAESSQGAADGGSVVLSYAESPFAAGTYYQGVEKVHFDTDGDGIVDDDELELNLVYQRQFNELNGGVAFTDATTVTTNGSDSDDLIIGFDIAGTQDSSDNYVRDYILAGGGDDYIYGGVGNDELDGGAGDDNYVWARGDGDDTIYEKSGEGTDKLRLASISLADVSFSRQHTGDNGVYTSTSVTLIIAESSQGAADGGSVALSYAEIASGTDTYYQGVEKVHFDTDGDGIVDADELELNLFYQRQFNDGASTTEQTKVTTRGSGSADLIIGFDIEGEKDATSTFYVRDLILANNGDNYVYGGDGNDRLEGGDGSDTINGGAGDDTINGAFGNDWLYGDAGDDVIYGYFGNDWLYGGADNDVLYGNAGDDMLYGEAGDDTYVWARGDGDDTIYEKSGEGTDKLRLTFISLADVTFGRPHTGGNGVYTSTSVTLTIAGQFGGDVVLSYEQYDSNGDGTIGGEDEYYQGVEKVHFDTDGDGIVDDDELVLNLIYQRQFNDGVAVTSSGTVTTADSGGDDLIIGFDIAGTKDPTDTYYVRDYIQAGGGDDYIYGGVGNDYIGGGAGDDTYVWARGAGDDIIYEVPNDGTDKLRLSGVNIVDVTFVRNPVSINDRFTTADVTLTIAASSQGATDGGRVALSYAEVAGSPDVFYDGVEKVHFDTDGDGIVDADELELNLIYQRQFNDAVTDATTVTTTGTDSDDLIIGLNLFGTKNLAGNYVRDSIKAGGGDDYIYGGVGNDVYFWDSSSGHDTITEYAGDGDDTLVLTGVSTNGFRSLERADDNGMVDASSDHLKLTFNSGSVLLKDSFNDNSTGVDRIHFDSNSNGVEDNNETVWLDENYGDADDDDYVWASGNGDRIIRERPGEGADDELRLDGVYVADVTFSRQHTVDSRVYTSTSVTLTIAGQSVIVLSYEQIPGSSPASYYQGVEKVYFDHDGDATFDLGELYLNLLYQRQFNNGVAVTSSDTVTTTGTYSDELIIGFDIADERDGRNYVRDRIEGGDGSDYVYGLNGDDYLYGNRGLDSLYGGVGNDTLYGGVDNDTLHGGVGNDTLYGGVDNDTLHGDAGNDVLHGGSHDDTLHGGDGDDTLYGNRGLDSLYGGVGNDLLYGETGNDTLYGGAGNDNIYGGDDNDTLSGDAGDDMLYGGAGNDIFYYYEGAGVDEITELEDKGSDALILTGVSESDLQSVERLGDSGGVDRNGSNLKLTFTTTTILNADGSTSMLGNSILLKNSINGNEAGVDSIHFDSNGDGIENNGEIVWQDGDFADMLT